MRAKLVNEKFEETSDPIEDMGIGTYESLIKQRSWYPHTVKGILIDALKKKGTEVLEYKNTLIVIHYLYDLNKWTARTDIYPPDSGSYVIKYDVDKEKLKRKVKAGITKKLRKWEQILKHRELKKGIIPYIEK